jgi:methylglutaconyl-CoA hydratase
MRMESGMPDAPGITYAVNAGVARITLNRPEKRNALNAELIGALRSAMNQAASDASARVILLRGAGKDFCAGMDLASFASRGDQSVMDHLADARLVADLFIEMRRNPRPIVAAVHGRALAGGAGLATACDLILAAESAQFRYTEVDLGFVPAIVTVALRRSVSEKRAFEMLAAGAAVTAAEGLAIGMVNHVYPDAEFDDRVEEYAVVLARKSASAAALTKGLLYNIDGMAFESALEAGVQTNALARMTDDARRGFEQFVTRKK